MKGNIKGDTRILDYSPCEEQYFRRTRICRNDMGALNPINIKNPMIPNQKP